MLGGQNVNSADGKCRNKEPLHDQVSICSWSSLSHDIWDDSRFSQCFYLYLMACSKSKNSTHRTFENTLSNSIHTSVFIPPKNITMSCLGLSVSLTSLSSLYFIEQQEIIVHPEKLDSSTRSVLYSILTSRLLSVLLDLTTNLHAKFGL